jgi:conjugal transfer pilus assembly protein TraK
VICPVDIKDVVYSEEKGLTVNLAGKNAFVKFLVVKKDGKEMYSMTPSELYFVCDGQVYTMIASPARIPAQTVQLVPGKAGTAKKNIEVYGELPFEKKIITIVKRVYTNDVPDSFTKIAVNRKMDIFKDLEVILRSIYAIEGEGLRVKELDVRISPASNLETISLKENDFLRTDVSLQPVAVSVESMTLKKGETSRVFVVERTDGGQS